MLVFAQDMDTRTQVICPPTLWFKQRVIMMGLLFLGFGSYFYYDGSVGYPKKNYEYLLKKTFEQAGSEFTEKKPTEAEWKQEVAKRKIETHAYPLPQGIDKNNLAWPEELGDYKTMNNGGWHQLWQQYSEKHKLNLITDEHPFDQSKIREQYIAGSVCILLFLVGIYLYVRTMKRRMALTGSEVEAGGITFNVSQIKRIDLRPWKVKGKALAYVSMRDGEAPKKVRLDGFVYGGFNRKDEPHTAEDFMNALKNIYEGEILDYADEVEPRTDSPQEDHLS